MQNPYHTLGVDRNASADEIKRAYRRLASQHHPDKGGDKARFQEIQGAYDILTDSQKRSHIDNPSNHGFGFQSSGPFDFQTIFDIFGTRFQQPHQQRVQQARMSLWITLADLYQGQKKTISIGTMAGTTTAEIDLPPGIDDGDTVQYSGLGPGGMDLLVTFRVHPDPRFQRQGANLITEQLVSIWDLILGADVIVRDLQGTNLALTLPASTQPGTVFRLKDRGLTQKNGNRGDLLIRMQGRIPNEISQDLLDQIRQNRPN
jgi:DnaJ-class molecular chaperone